MRKIYLVTLLIITYNLSYSSNFKTLQGYISCNTKYVSDTTMNMNFIMQLSTPDIEYADSLSLIFPAGFTINYASDSIGSETISDFSSQTISWGDNNNYIGGIEAFENVELYNFFVNVTISPSVSGNQKIQYYISGDEYGETPHEITGETEIKPDPAYMQCAGDETKLTITLKTDKFGNETTWFLTDTKETHVYDSGGPYQSLDTGELYINKVCIKGGGNLLFTIWDDYGDGICCLDGNGYYLIETPCDTVKKGGLFNWDEEVRFTMPYSKTNNFNWEKTYGYKKNEVGNSITQLCDGGYLIAGSTESNTYGGRDFLFMRLDAMGKIKWEKNYGTPQNDFASDMIQTSDGNHVLVGQTYELDNSWINAYVIKLNENGDTIWTNKWGNTSDKKWPYCGIEDDANNLMLIGENNDSLYIIKMNADGNILMEKTIFDPNYYFVSRSDIAKTSGGEFIISIYKKNRSSGNIFLSVIKIDTDGNILFEKTFDITDTYYWQTGITATSDGNFVAVGHKKDTANYNYNDLFYVKISPTGNVLWEKTYHKDFRSFFAREIIKSSDNHLVLTGYTGVYNTEKKNWTYEALLLKMDVNGNVLWETHHEKNTSQAAGKALCETGNGGYAICGYDVDEDNSTSDRQRIDAYVFVTGTEGSINQVFQDESICMVTVDRNSGNNLITWEKTPGEGTASYNIYKESDVAAEYTKIGSVPYDSNSVFIDTASNPKTRADRYKISCVNANDLESRLSQHHKTIHLQVSPGQDAGTFQLDWDDYEGFDLTTYHIYRGTSINNMSLIASLPSSINSFTDLYAPSDIRSYYQVAITRSSVCNPNSKFKASTGPFSQSLSNIEDNRLREENFVPVLTGSITNLKTYPNPFKQALNIEYTINTPGQVLLALYDMYGKQVSIIDTGTKEAGTYTLTHTIEIPGMYLLRLQKDEDVVTKKVVGL